MHADGSTIYCEFDHGEYVSTPPPSSSLAAATPKDNSMAPVTAMADNIKMENDNSITTYEAHPQVDGDVPVHEVPTDNASSNVLLLLPHNHLHHQQQHQQQQQSPATSSSTTTAAANHNSSHHHQQHQQQQQSPPTVAVSLSSRGEIVSPLKKQSRRVKKAREVEMAGYSPLNPSYLLNGGIFSNNTGGSSVENEVDPAVSIVHSRRIILKPHHYS